MFKKDLALNDLQRLISIKLNQTKPNQTKPNQIYYSSIIFSYVSVIIASRGFQTAFKFKILKAFKK